MNIFILDKNPRNAAKDLCDKHVVKMILESCQILCSVFYFSDTLPDSVKIPYKLTHKNHPCCIWARESLGNFNWLLKYTEALLQEYYLRYGKRHKSTDVYLWIKDNIYYVNIKKSLQTPFVQCMPDKYKDKTNAVKAYRRYYIYEKMKFAKWKTGVKPIWLIKTV